MTEPLHLRPHAPVAHRALLPGDPGRALRLAQALCDKPAMLNHNRGLWGYTGAARIDGEPLTIQSTGMGGPSAAIVTEELVQLGARRLVRAGTCGALGGRLRLGDLVVLRAAHPGDGASRALGARDDVPADPVLTDRLAGAAGVEPVLGVSTDLFYADRDWAGTGAAVVEMEAAAVFAVARRHGAQAACVLLVTDVLGDGGRERISPEDLEAGELRLGDVAAAALAGGPPPEPATRR